MSVPRLANLNPLEIREKKIVKNKRYTILKGK